MADSTRARGRRWVFAAIVALIGTFISASATPVDAEEDTATPVLSSVTRASPDTIAPGQQVSIAYAAADTGTGIRSAQFSFTGPIGNVLYLSTEEESPTGPATVTVASSAPGGPYELSRVSLFDFAGNHVSYERDGTVHSLPAGAQAPSAPHSFDFSAADFTLDNANGDTTTPALNGFVRESGHSLVPGQSVTMWYSGSDTGTAIAAALFAFTGPTGNTFEVRRDGPGPAQATIEPSTPDGTYQLTSVLLMDRALNYVVYERGGQVSRYPTGADGPSAPHGLDFASADFVVVNPSEDATTPTLSSFSRTSNAAVSPGEVVLINYSVSDSGAGVGFVMFVFRGPTENSFEVRGEESVAPSGPATGTVAAWQPDGEYRLSWVEVVDKDHNRTVYKRDGSLTREPAGASGPSDQHSLDFAAADFVVNNRDEPPPTTSTTSTTTTTSTTSTTTTTTTSTTTTTTTVPPRKAAQITTGAGAGGGPHVRSFAANGTALATSFFAWASQFGGGVPVARGDLDGDGRDEIIAGSGPGGAAFAVFSADGTKRFAKLAFGAFTGGVTVAVGDVTGDARPEIVVAAGPGGGPRVRVFSNTGQALGEGFMAYGSGFSGGVRVAVGKVDGASKARIVTAPGAGGGPHVRAFNATGTPVGGNGFFAYEPSFTGGVFVATGDLDGDGHAEIVTAPGAGGGPHVRAFRLNGSETFGVMAYAPTFTGGVRVAAGNLTGDSKAEVVTGPGPSGGPHVRAFSGSGGALPVNFFAYDPSSTSGTFVAIGRA